MIIGTGVALLCVNTDVYVGPIATALGGADLSAFAGPVLGASVYGAVTLYQRRARPMVAAPVPEPAVETATAR